MTNNAAQYPYFIQLSGKKEVAVDPGVDIVLNNPFEIFDHKWKEYSDNVSWVEADGSWLTRNAYPTAYDTLLEEWSNGVETTETINGHSVQYRLSSHKRRILVVDNEAICNTLYNETGIAWYYIIDTTNKRFKLPRTKWGFVGDRGDAGGYVPESLPNHTHFLAYQDAEGVTGGAGYIPDTSKNVGSVIVNTGTNGPNTNGVFSDRSSSAYSTARQQMSNASLSNSSYQDGAPVQQRATQMKLYFYVGEAIANPNYINAEALMKDVIEIAENKSTEIEEFADNEYAKIVEEANKQLAKISMQGLVPFDVVQKDHRLTFDESNGYAELGTYVWKESVAGSRYGYPDFYNLCLSEYNVATEEDLTVDSQTIKVKRNSNGHVYYDVADKAIIDTIYANTGIAWYYGIDTENERICLPRNDYYFINQSTNPGGYVEESVPNVKGDISTVASYQGSEAGTGAFKTTQKNSGIMSTGGAYQWLQVNLDASRSSPAYQDGAVVKPRSVAVIPYMIVGTVDVETTVTEVTQTTSTENDTLPLFTPLSFPLAPNSLTWLPADSINDGNEYLSVYTILVNYLTNNPDNLKIVETALMEEGTNYDEYWVVNTFDVTFRTPVTAPNFTDNSHLYFKVGNVVQNLQLVDVDTLQRNKADIHLSNVDSNIDYITEQQLASAENNYTWYRKYRSGIVEQGGKIVVSSTATAQNTYVTTTLTFPVPMSSLYSWKCQARHDRFNVGFNAIVGDPATSVTVYQVNDSAASYTNPFVLWECKGFM